MKATYQPKHNNYFSYLDCCIGKEFVFKEALPVGKTKKFWPIDKNFPSSTPVSEDDLIFEEK